jgi:uncharacterized protein YcsI (UPF0317 family)
LTLKASRHRFIAYQLSDQAGARLSACRVGDPHSALGIDRYRTDIPRYRVWRNSVIEEADRHHGALAGRLAFVIGCSFSFEEALLRTAEH